MDGRRLDRSLTLFLRRQNVQIDRTHNQPSMEVPRQNRNVRAARCLLGLGQYSSRGIECLHKRLHPTWLQEIVNKSSDGENWLIHAADKAWTDALSEEKANRMGPDAEKIGRAQSKGWNRVLLSN